MRNFDKICKILAIFLQTRDSLQITQVRIFSSHIFIFKNEARGNWNFVQVLYMVSKNQFLIYFWNIYKIADKIGKMSEILDIFQKKNQKSVTWIFRYHTTRGTPGWNCSFLASFLKKKSVPALFWENRVFVINSQNLTDFVKIYQILAFVPIKSPNFITSH